MPIIVSMLEDGIACVRISNVTRRNALDLEMFQSLAVLWPRLASDENVRVVLLRGDGDQFFCSGADLSADLESAEGIADLVDRALLKTQFFPKPVIAAIRGGCVAGGLELAMSADIRIASEGAKIGFPEVRWGIVPSGGAAMKLADQIGQAHALDLLLTGRIISGTEAQLIGLVSSVCCAEDVLSSAIECARSLAANSSVAVQATKRCALLHRTERYARMEAEERAIVEQVKASGDYKEGKSAFLEKRSPNFLDIRGKAK